jgi:hypothetical protein
VGKVKIKKMIEEGLKLTYSFNEIEGVRNHIRYEIGDLVWCYMLSENYRHLHPEKKFDRKKCIIIEVSDCNDGKHFEQYGVQEFESGKRGWWHYPTFLEPLSALGQNEC